MEPEDRPDGRNQHGGQEGHANREPNTDAKHAPPERRGARSIAAAPQQLGDPAQAVTGVRNEGVHRNPSKNGNGLDDVLARVNQATADEQNRQPDTIPAPSTARLNRIRRRSHHKTTSKAGLMNGPYNGILRLHAGEGAATGGGVPSSTPRPCQVHAYTPFSEYPAARLLAADRAMSPARRRRAPRDPMDVAGQSCRQSCRAHAPSEVPIPLHGDRRARPVL